MTGVLVTRVSAHSAIRLEVDDVIVTIDGRPVGNDGTIELRPSELVNYHCLFTCKRAGDATTLQVVRAGEQLELSGVLCPLPHVLPRANDFDCCAEYVIVGGLVFTRLAGPMLEDKRAKGRFSAIFDLVHHQLAESFAPAVVSGEEATQVLVLSEILAAPLNYGCAPARLRMRPRSGAST